MRRDCRAWAHPHEPLLCLDDRAHGLRRRGHRTFDEARANIAANKAEIPGSCSNALNQLFRLETEWAKKSFDELFELCDVDLGKLVLETERSGAKSYMCPDGILSIKKSLAGFKQTGKYPELTAEVAAVPGCT